VTITVHDGCLKSCFIIFSKSTAIGDQALWSSTPETKAIKNFFLEEIPDYGEVLYKKVNITSEVHSCP